MRASISQAKEVDAYLSTAYTHVLSFRDEDGMLKSNCARLALLMGMTWLHAGAGAAATSGNQPEGMTSTPYTLESYETSVGMKPIVPGDPASFDLYGFKLGMSVREAERNAKRLRLRFNGGDGTNPSFDGRVAIRAANLLGRRVPNVPRVLARTTMKDATGNRYILKFLPMEAGASLVGVTYLGSWEGNSPAQYLTALQNKFGKPTHRSIGATRFDARWCSKGDSILALCDDRPALGAGGSNEVGLFLILGSRASRELDRRIETQATAVAAAERKVPSF